MVLEAKIKVWEEIGFCLKELFDKLSDDSGRQCLVQVVLSMEGELLTSTVDIGRWWGKHFVWMDKNLKTKFLKLSVII